eukprot:CAMPEP_0178561258 /NCGR_PEP_ID=MMETSP0697-20121206/11914_1 /TAXON_ID=265572 /ORGANISM="Extubocellulus spinifer, Strain CCMP396" /LENGTH=96 /DNA_ID=CAMNT_0020194549 /DNA_START=67 /DNA_END=357 /DNA_ORIENTATION=-
MSFLCFECQGTGTAAAAAATARLKRRSAQQRRAIPALALGSPGRRKTPDTGCASRARIGITSCPVTIIGVTKCQPVQRPLEGRRPVAVASPGPLEC